LLSNDLRRAEREAESLEPYLELAPARQAVLIEMVFNQGLPHVRGFKKMLSALVQQDFALASFELMSSQWAGQVGARAVQLAEQMKTGQWAS
jgi:lysozyme